MTESPLDIVQRAIRTAIENSNKEYFFIGIDGRSGSGKTALGDGLGKSLNAEVFHLEDLYQGWNGLEQGIEIYDTEVLPPLSKGVISEYLAWNWYKNETAIGMVRPSPVMIFEGVGACNHRAMKFLDYSIWVDCSAKVRKERALRRDGEIFAPHWEEWAEQEDKLLDKYNPQKDVDLIVEN